MAWPSRLICTSSSMASMGRVRAWRKAARVFSGARWEPPRWATRCMWLFIKKFYVSLRLNADCAMLQFSHGMGKTRRICRRGTWLGWLREPSHYISNREMGIEWTPDGRPQGPTPPLSAALAPTIRGWAASVVEGRRAIIKAHSAALRRPRPYDSIRGYAVRWWNWGHFCYIV